jgi:hypothetical protein
MKTVYENVYWRGHVSLKTNLLSPIKLYVATHTLCMVSEQLGQEKVKTAKYSEVKLVFVS